MPIDFSAHHPSYDARIETMMMARDFYRGGQHVLHPRSFGRRSFVNNLRFVRTVSNLDAQTHADPSGPAQSRNDGLVTHSGATYLWSHIRESVENFADRRRRADHWPLFRGHVDSYVSSALQVEPERKTDGLPGDAVWSDYWDNVDRRGTNIASFIRVAAAKALQYGYVFAFTDRQPISSPVANAAQQRALGFRSYSYLVMPTDVINWSVDEQGQLRWLVIEEPAPDDRAPGEPFPDQTPVPVQYVLWTREVRQVWEKARPDVAYIMSTPDGKWGLRQQFNHGLGEVPASILYARRANEDRTELEADSMLSDSLFGDQKLFNLKNLLEDTVYKQGFSVFAFPRDEQGGPQAVSIGTDVGVLFDATAGQPLYVSPDAQIIAVQMSIIEKYIAIYDQRAGLGRGKAEFSKEERSAASLNIESRAEARRIASLVESIEEFDHTLHRHVAMFEGLADWPKPSYSRDVTLRSTSAEIADIVQLSNVRGVSTEAIVALSRPIVAKMMSSLGQNQSDIEAAVRSLGKDDQAFGIALDQALDQQRPQNGA